MPEIIVKNKYGARDPKGTKGFHSFKNFSVKENKPKPEGIKVGKAGRSLVASDEQDEAKSARQKYLDNYDRIFKK